jgi:phosphatidylglycerol:prolipoprotein diacylglycerol transferase
MIHIGMDPNIFTAGSFTMSWHGLFTGLAVLAAVILSARLSKEKAIAIEDVYSIALWGVIGGIIGARLFHVIDKWSTIYQYNPKQMLYFWEGGLSLYGALVGGFVFGITYAAIRKLPLGKVSDLAAPGMVLAQAIGRIGCLINGDAYGTPTSLPWGVLYTHPDAEATAGPWVNGQLVAGHPVPAYEIIWDLLILALLLRLRKRLKNNWMLFLIYASLYSVGRFGFSFVRGDEEAVLGPLHQAQVISLIIIVVAVPLITLLSIRPTPNLKKVTWGTETETSGLENISTEQMNDYLQQGAKFVVFQYCISIGIKTFKRSSDIFVIRAGESAVGGSLPFTLVSLFLGWWGLPWGPIYTVSSVVTNLRGGKDITRAVIAAVNDSAPSAG